MYVLDTNTLIYFFKGMGNVAQRLLATSPQELAIPAIVLYELEVGIAKSASPGKRRQQLGQFTSLVTILPFAEKEAATCAAIRARLEKKGTPIDPLDVLIGGTALANNGVLVTRNTAEFKRINKLKVEDWF